MSVQHLTCTTVLQCVRTASHIHYNTTVCRYNISYVLQYYSVSVQHLTCTTVLHCVSIASHMYNSMSLLPYAGMSVWQLTCTFASSLHVLQNPPRTTVWHEHMYYRKSPHTSVWHVHMYFRKSPRTIVPPSPHLTWPLARLMSEAHVHWAKPSVHRTRPSWRGRWVYAWAVGSCCLAV